MLRQYLELPRSVHVLCLGTFVNRAATFLIPFLTLYLTERHGFDAEFATRCLGLYGFGSIGAALVGGHLADWIGRRAVMIGSLLGGACVLTVFPVLSSKAAIVTAMLLFPFVAEMYRPAVSAMIGDLVEPARRPQAYGLMYVSINLGVSFGPAIGGRIIEAFSYAFLFRIDALTTAIFAGIILLAIRETLAPIQTPAAGAEDSLGVDGVAHGATRIRLLPALGQIARDTVFLTLCLGSVLWAAVFMQMLSTLPLYLASLGFSPADYGLLISCNGVMIVLFQLPLTSLLARFHRGSVIVAGALLTAAGFGLMGAAETKVHFLLTAVVWTAGEMMHVAYMSAIINDLAPPALRGRYMGLFSMSFSLAMMLGVPIGGMVLARYGGGAVWGGSACVAALAGGLYLLIRHRLTPPVIEVKPESGGA